MHWVDETCKFESTFDSTKLTRHQIDNCLRIAKWQEFRLTNSPMVFQPSDILRLDSNRLCIEYLTKSKELKILDLPKTAFWQDYRNKTIEELNSHFNLSIIKYRSYYDLSALYSYLYTDSCIAKHVKALNSDTAILLQDWLLIRQQMATRNGYPDKVMNEYRRMLNSDIKLTYAKIDILNFGWWNCAINYLVKVEDSFGQDNVLKEIESLFISTKIIECDEP